MINVILSGAYVLFDRRDVQGAVSVGLRYSNLRL